MRKIIILKPKTKDIVYFWTVQKAILKEIFRTEKKKKNNRYLHLGINTNRFFFQKKDIGFKKRREKKKKILWILHFFYDFEIDDEDSDLLTASFSFNFIVVVDDGAGGTVDVNVNVDAGVDVDVKG